MLLLDLTCSEGELKIGCREAEKSWKGAYGNRLPESHVAGWGREIQEVSKRSCCPERGKKGDSLGRQQGTAAKLVCAGSQVWDSGVLVGLSSQCRPSHLRLHGGGVGRVSEGYD